MLWVLAGIGGLWLAFVSPSFRKVALALIGLLAAAVFFIYLYEKDSEAKSKALENLIPHNQVVFSNVNVSDNGYGSQTISGDVRNDSNHDISDMMLSYEIFDCPSEQSPVNRCLSVGKDDDIYLYNEVPSHSARSFEEHLNLINVAQPNGFRKTIYRLKAVTAKG